MKQLLILSGKGGTGKTTIATSFIRLAQARAYADCDVEAPNLHLIYGNDKDLSEASYYAMPTAVVNADKCISCGECERNCRFGAIKLVDGRAKVSVSECEGCSVCEYVCPADAIEMKQLEAGKIMLYKGDTEVFSSARLNIGRGTSGKLVTEVKKNLRSNATHAELAIIDGSPGIGCPVVASISGVDMVLIVAEPSISGIYDMKRIIDTARSFNVRIAVCVNKYDLNEEKTREIEGYLKKENINSVGRLPYDGEAVKSMNSGKCVIDGVSKLKDAIQDVFNKTMDILYE